MRRTPPRVGIDFNSGVEVSRAKANGFSFVGRYHSDDGWAVNRNLTPAEAKAWAETRTDIFSIWQNGKAEGVLLGRPQGVHDAGVARHQQAECGGVGQPIYFAVDFWMKPEQRSQVADYFDGVRAVLGAARIGAYGPTPVMNFLFDIDAIDYGWHSRIGGFWQDRDRWHPQAQLRQVTNLDHVPDADKMGSSGYVCIDHAVEHDFGQWRAKLP